MNPVPCKRGLKFKGLPFLGHTVCSVSHTYHEILNSLMTEEQFFLKKHVMCLLSIVNTGVLKRYINTTFINFLMLEHNTE